jgi:hypothetical protein
MWGLYAAYTWTVPGGPSIALIRFYLPALGAVSLLAARPVVRGSHWLGRVRWTAVGAPVLVLVALFGLGIWSFTSMTGSGPVLRHVSGGPHPAQPAPGPGGAPGPVPGPAQPGQAG